MADISIIEKIANNQPISPATDFAQVADTNKIFKRAGASPADVTEVFMNRLSAEAYAKGELYIEGGYQDGEVAYVGQHISVVDKDAKTAEMYQIQNTDGDLKKIVTVNATPTEYDLDNYTLGEYLEVLTNKLGSTVKPEE